ncbi:hypothetical protein [Capsulimonas sp.]|uniref:hypothetical protein n=2 Tax=Capsulimonas sp. TaxID=2494211 RepID=UPI003267B9DA
MKPYNSDWDTLVVEAGGAKLRLIPFTKHFWRNTNEFRAAVSARALSSVVGEWKALGCRQNELISLEFVYPTSTHRRKVFISTSLWLGSTFGMGFGIVHSSEVIALGMGWLTSLMLGVTVFFTTSMWWVGTFLNMEALRRKRHHIATGVEGISFSDGVHRIHAPWASITRYERTDLGEILATRQRYVVHTSDGDFDFTPAITDFLLLDRIIREQAAEYQFNVSTTETDALGGESACWSGGYAGKGDRIFHYRTRGHRALLWMGTLMTLVLPFAYQIGLYAEIPHHPGDPPPAAIYSIIVLVTMWGWGRYYSARIEISEIGISEHSAFGTKHLRWTEIVSVTESNNVITLHGDGKKVRYWDTIVNAADLDSEIERRAVKCTIRHDKDGKNK